MGKPRFKLGMKAAKILSGAHGNQGTRILMSNMTRSQAIGEGILVDVSDLARAVGFLFPVALSRGVFRICLGEPDERDIFDPVTDYVGQRIGSLLQALHAKISEGKALGNLPDLVEPDGKRLRFSAELPSRRTDRGSSTVPAQRPYICDAICHVSPQGRPALTILLGETESN